MVKTKDIASISVFELWRLGRICWRQGGETYHEQCSLLQSFADELEQRLRGWFVGQAEGGVDLGVVGLFGTEDRGETAILLRIVAELFSASRV
ncbi:MAG: hypothetical protein AABP62_31115 [Planctomycetota bacterium]